MLQKQARQLNTNDDNSITAKKIGMCDCLKYSNHSKNMIKVIM